MRKNKLISMICAIAMIMSMFSAFTVANAAGQAITSEATLSGDNAVITVSYSGFTSVSSLQVDIPLDDTIFDVTKLSDASYDMTLDGEANYRDDIKAVRVAFVPGSAKSYGPSESEVIKVTVPVKDKSKLPVDIKLSNVKIIDFIDKSNKTTYASDDVTSVDTKLAVTEGSLVDPSVTPTPTPRPTAPPRPTAKPVVTPDPSATTAPTKKPVVTDGHRIGGTATVDGSNAVIKLSYAGFTSVSSLQVDIPLDDTIFDVTKLSDASYDMALDGEANYRDDIKAVRVAFVPGSAKSYGPSESDIITITVPIKDASKLPVDLDLKNVKIIDFIDKSNKTTYASDDVTSVNDKLAVNAVTVGASDEPTATPTPLPKNTEISVKDFVASDAAAKAADAEKDKDTYMTIVLKDKDGNVVVDSNATDDKSVDNNYGKTFVATWTDPKTKETTQLTNDEFQAIINGYDSDRKISDALNGALGMNIFDNSGITNVSTTVNAVDDQGNAEQISDPVDNEPISSGPKATPKAPTYNVSPATKTVDGGDSVKVTATLTKNDAKDGTIKVSVDTLGSVDGDGITVVAKKVNAVTAQATDAADAEATLGAGTKSVTFTDATGADTVTIEATFKVAAGTTKNSFTLTFDYVDATGASLLAKNSKNTSVITVNKQSTTSDKKSSSGSGSGSTSSGGNILASGNVGGTAAAPGGLYFTDLNDAPWAATAIATLASQNIVSGRGDGTFDPNANITRAEYCQILINTINASTNYADTYFNDVPTDAWFYHAVAVASSLGIVSGYGDGNFGPYDLITREQMALMTLKAAQVQNVNLSATASASFSDDAQIADWSKDAVYTLANAGIINGMDDGTFAPRANATRAQASVIIYNTFLAK